LAKVFCLAGIGCIALALVLACGGARACVAVSPGELDGICGGACEEVCGLCPSYGCTGSEATGPCSPVQGPGGSWSCPFETAKTSCVVNHTECSTAGPGIWCEEFEEYCTGTFLTFTCVADDDPNTTDCYWLEGQWYDCWTRSPSTYTWCRDGPM
jgi:hypothetical protein